MEPRRVATGIALVGFAVLILWVAARTPPPTERVAPPAPTKKQRTTTPIARPVSVTVDAGPPQAELPKRIEVRVGVHLATAFASGTRIDQHLEQLDKALIGRLDLYAHALPGSGLTLWEDDSNELVAAAIPLGDGSRFVVGRYTGPDAVAGWYDARGYSLHGPIETRPVPLTYVTSAFGERLHPVSGTATMHSGVDYGAPTGTPVRAVADGMVSSYTISPTAGIALELTHADDYRSRYLHLDGVAATALEGTPIRAGDVIGFVGATGLATGPHLHFELHRGDVAFDAAGLLPPSSSTRLPPRALAAHQARLHELILDQLKQPTVPPSWRPSTTVRAPPPPPSAWGPLNEAELLTPEEDRALELLEIEARARTDARAYAEAEARDLANAEREARTFAAELAAANAEVEAERERDARAVAAAMAEAQAQARAYEKEAARALAAEASKAQRAEREE